MGVPEKPVSCRKDQNVAPFLLDGLPPIETVLGEFRDSGRIT